MVLNLANISNTQWDAIISKQLQKLPWATLIWHETHSNPAWEPMIGIKRVNQATPYGNHLLLTLPLKGPISNIRWSKMKGSKDFQSYLSINTKCWKLSKDDIHTKVVLTLAIWRKQHIDAFYFKFIYYADNSTSHVRFNLCLTSHIPKGIEIWQHVTLGPKYLHFESKTSTTTSHAIKGELHLKHQLLHSTFFYDANHC